MSDKPKYLTIDEAIDQLQVIAAQSPLGGDTVVYACIGGIEYQPVSEIKMDRSQDGAIALYCAYSWRCGAWPSQPSGPAAMIVH